MQCQNKLRILIGFSFEKMAFSKDLSGKSVTVLFLRQNPPPDYDAGAVDWQ
jgi:hypothetical protein